MVHRLHADLNLRPELFSEHDETKTKTKNNKKEIMNKKKKQKKNAAIEDNRTATTIFSRYLVLTYVGYRVKVQIRVP